MSYTRKSRFLASAGLAYCDDSMPFRAAYFLGEGNVGDVVIQPLSASELLVQFLSNSFQLDIESPTALSRGFDGTAELCRHVQGFHLDYPRDYGALAGFAKPSRSMPCALHLRQQCRLIVPSDPCRNAAWPEQNKTAGVLLAEPPRRFKLRSYQNL